MRLTPTTPERWFPFASTSMRAPLARSIYENQPDHHSQQPGVCKQYTPIDTPPDLKGMDKIAFELGTSSAFGKAEYTDTFPNTYIPTPPARQARIIADACKGKGAAVTWGGTIDSMVKQKFITEEEAKEIRISTD